MAIPKKDAINRNIQLTKSRLRIVMYPIIGSRKMNLADGPIFSMYPRNVMLSDIAPTDK